MLSVREWTGKPYFSKQIEIASLTKAGIQKADVEIYNGKPFIVIDDRLKYMIYQRIIVNDGLNYFSFVSWFKKPIIDGCVIHFGDFQY